MQQWCVVRAEPSRERVARRWITRAAYEVWLPECVVRRKCRWKGDFAEHARGPLFPGYLFVRFDPGARQWREIDEMIGVIGVLCNAEAPMAVPEREMTDLQRLAAADGGVFKIDAGRRRPLYITGEPLRVTDEESAWGGHVGLYVAEHKDRITLLLDILGRSMPISFSEAQVEPA